MKLFWFVAMFTISAASVAAPVQVQFTGTVDTRLWGTAPSTYPVEVGTTFSGWFRYDSDSSLASSMTSSELYLDPIHWDITSYLFEGPSYGFEISFGDQTVTYDAVLISVYDTDSSEATDRFSVLASETYAHPGLANFDLTFGAESSVFSGTQLPPSIPNLLTAGFSYGETSAAGTQLEYFVTGNATAAITAVPLPPAILLLGSSLFLFGIMNGAMRYGKTRVR